MKITPSKLKRDEKVIVSKMKRVKGAIIAEETLYVVFPKRYSDKSLAVIDVTVDVLMVFAIMDTKGNYTIRSGMVMVEMSPSSVGSADADGAEQYVLVFEKGDTIITSETVVKKDTIVYDYFNEFIIRANIPWFLNDADVGNMVSTAKELADSNVGNNPLAISLLTAIISRSPTDVSELYRHAVNANPALLKVRPKYVGLLNVYSTFNTTVARTAGSYTRSGLTAAVNDPEKKSSAIEKSLRA